MRLDRLEISGFKSFPDRADVAFDVGVTAIVGPNGCGKSNLVDAITWVLGEQSAKSLRGERMEDVIFSGSDARKATGAAEVRLRLSGVPTEAARRAATRAAGLDGVEVVLAEPPGTEPQQVDLPAIEVREVEIARRLYRSGESEYLIDGEGCRLRDVQDLLMDAGVGVKAYAVIEQGKIGQILGAKPTERRQLIEEAAGVTKYKSRRRAAELKLDAAQQNLTRVDDIIFEIEKQRTTLKRQAAKARRYKRLRDELRRWEKVLFARRYRALSQHIEASRARLEAARERETAAASRLVEVEQQFTEARSALQRADEAFRDARDRMHARQLDNDRREQQLAFNRQQIDLLASSSEQVSSEIAALELRREPARVELEARRGSALAAERERQDAAAVLAEAERTAAQRHQALEALEHEVDETRGRLFASQNTVVTLQYAIERSQDGRTRIADALQRLDAETQDARIEAERLRAEHLEAESGLAQARGAIDEAVAARAAQEAMLAATRLARQQRTADLKDREREFTALVARLRSLEELDAHREGFGDAARLILGDSLAISHHGSVADYLETDTEHERVVEALLADFLQCVIVGSHDEARRGLEYVRERNAGRIGFLVAADRGAAPATGEPVAGAVNVTSLLRVTGPYRDAILDALRDTWVAPDASAAEACSQHVTGPVATPAGDVYRGGRLVYGGARTEARGILAMKREIKELRQSQGNAQLTVDALIDEVTALERTIAATEETLGRLAAERHHQEKLAVALELQVQRAAGELDRLARKQDQIGNERRQAEEERRSLDQREEEARDEIARIEVDRREWQEQLTDAQRRLAEARESAAEAVRSAAETKAQHAALVERATAFAADVVRLEDVGRELEARIAQRLDDRRRGDDRRQALEAAIEQGERQRVEDAEVMAALREEVSAAERGAAERQQQAEADEQATRASRVQLEEARTELAQADVARATTESDLNHLAQVCTDTLQATLEEVASEVEALEQAGEATPDARAIYGEDETDVDAETDSGEAAAPVKAVDAAAEAAAVGEHLTARALTAEEAIAELRAKIDRLGPVNMMAIEQFDELEQRHTFLVAQRKDLVDSIAAAGEAIKRIDHTTRERFQEAFVAINRNFEETFTTLFGGGRAGLVLLDESDLLESGIDIIAQPPGKRLQNVQLLSGGEKALTAMALMFGIFRYRPSPFCLLDEIDAPLDDANIGRFIEMLRGMQEHTQFILVTHHRKTMEIADRLYGVTMEEPGVSKLISIRLH